MRIQTSPKLPECSGKGWVSAGARPAYSGVTFPLVEPCLEHAAKLGYRRVVVFPYFLFSGILVDRIYGFTDLVAKRHPGIEFVKAGYLNDHPDVIATFAERAKEILDGNTAMNCSLCKYRTPGAWIRIRSRPAAGEPSPPCGRPGRVRSRIQCR